jgi:hypothetical protein
MCLVPAPLCHSITSPMYVLQPIQSYHSIGKCTGYATQALVIIWWNHCNSYFLPRDWPISILSSLLWWLLANIYPFLNLICGIGSSWYPLQLSLLREDFKQPSWASDTHPEVPVCSKCLLFPSSYFTFHPSNSPIFKLLRILHIILRSFHPICALLTLLVRELRGLPNRRISYKYQNIHINIQPNALKLAPKIPPSHGPSEELSFGWVWA